MRKSVLLSGKHKSVGVPLAPEIKNLFPQAPVVTHKGNPFIVLPHGRDETRFLRNIGYEVDAPIVHQYDWCGGSPFSVQVRTAAMLTLNDRAYVLNGMGTGKTKAALWAWHFLYKTGAAKKLLVAAPLSTLNFTWAGEVFATLPGIKANVLYGDRAKRLKLLADTEADVYIINHDGVKTIEKELMLRNDIDTLVIDELAAFRNGTAQRTKMMRKIAARMEHVWGMTGSPTPNAPTDAWGQASIVTPHTIPKRQTRFRDMVMHQVSQFRYVPKKDALDHVYNALQPAVRFTLDDVVELPELVERTLDIDLGVKQAKVYSEMEKAAFAAVAGGEITAVNAGAVLMKLLQISTGWVYDKDRNVHKLDGDARLDALVDALSSTENKAIVFVPFIHALDGIAERLKAEGMSFEVVSGSVPKRQRDNIFARFQSTVFPRVLLAHPQCMSHGLTLTAADTVIWYSPVTSLETFEQANARIRRVGQKRKQLVLMLQGTKSERYLYTRLRNKQAVQNVLLSMYEASMSEAD